MIAELDQVAHDTGFCGAVRVEADGVVLHEGAYGFAHRALNIHNTPDTQFALASGAKAFTALTVMRLVEEGALSLATTARSLLGADLPLIDRDVRVEHLLSHRSGIGDYLDESAGHDISDYVMPVPVHRLLHTEDYVPALDGHPQVFAPGERFQYCNGGFVVLALLIERATGTPFHDVVHRCVVVPAGLGATAFLRSDRLPGSAALGYLDDEEPGWSNVLHLPVRGSGDGGIYSTVGDVCRLWRAIVAGEVVSADSLRDMTTARSSPATTSGSYDYGLGMWLRNPRHTWEFEGYDAGVSFNAGHDTGSGITYAVCANTSEGGGPMADSIRRCIDDGLGAARTTN